MATSDTIPSAGAVPAQATVPAPGAPAPTAPATPTAPEAPGYEPSAHLTAVLKTYAHRAGLAVALLAVLVLVGWAADVRLLRGMMPGRVSMNPMTAVCFLLAGFALWALRSERTQDKVEWAGLLCAAAAVLVALAKLADYLPGVEPQIDRLLFRARVEAEANRMAPNTALCFLLVAGAMLLRDGPRHWAYRVAAVMTLAAGCVAMLALIGYAYDVDGLTGVGEFIPMAVNTAVGFLVLCLGVLGGCPEREPVSTILADTDGGFMARRLLPAAFFLPLFVGWLCNQGEAAGYYGPRFGVTVYTLAIIVLFISLIWWTARYLHKLDLKRERAEAALRDSEAVYHSLVETLPQNILRKDLDGRFTFGNRNFLRELGRSAEDVIGKTDYDFFARELADRYRRDDRRVTETGQQMDAVEEHVTPAGEKLYVQVMKTPVRDADGRILGIQGIFWDVTARKLAEQELERTNRQLAESVESERRAIDALKQAQSTMVQTEKLASLGQMVAGVAHEINNPLAFVSNNVAVLQRDLRAMMRVLEMYQQAADPVLEQHRPEVLKELREFAQQIDLAYTLNNVQDLLDRSREGMRRIQQIVRDLRAFARLDESDLHEIDLNEGVRSTVNIIQGAAKRKQMRIEMDLGDLPPVTCYPAKVNQVVMNLLSNAIDASPDDTVVTVRTRRESSGNAVRIEVEDHGSGIPPEVRDRIFDPFFTTKPPGEGTGLGLSISYGIVRDHGGRIAVQSEVGKGTTFTVVLPTKPEPRDTPPAGAS